MLRSGLIFIAILVAGAGAAFAQSTADPLAVAPAVYSDAPLASPNCTDSRDPECVPESPSSDEQANAGYPPDYDYVPDYWEAAPAYVAPSFYLGISLAPAYWAWPWYGYGWGYGWPYYGYAYGWPYYGYCCYWGYSYAWHDHGHDHHDHGHWGDHGGHDHGGWNHGGGNNGGWAHDGHGNSGSGTNGYPGPYRYLGHGQYANQAGTGRGTVANADRPTRMAGGTPAPSPDAAIAHGAAPRNTSGFADVRGAARTAAFAGTPGAGQGRFAGRAVLPSAAYAAAARSGASSAFVDRGARGTNYRGNSPAGYGYGHGNTGGGASLSEAYGRAYAGRSSSANQGNRGPAASSPSYASSRYAESRQSMARAGNSVASRNYGAGSSYPQQRYAAGNRVYSRGSAPAYSAGRPSMPSYAYAGRGSMSSYARGGSMPSYARGGGYSAPHGGGGGSAAHSSGGVGGSHGGGGHAGGTHGR